MGLSNFQTRLPEAVGKKKDDECFYLIFDLLFFFVLLFRGFQVWFIARQSFHLFQFGGVDVSTMQSHALAFGSEPRDGHLLVVML